MLPEPPEIHVDLTQVVDKELMPDEPQFIAPKLITRLVEVMKAGDGSIRDQAHLIFRPGRK
jgi:hypothetical protein